jgi:hypothetical protein
MAIGEETLEIAIDTLLLYVAYNLPQSFSQRFNLEPSIIKPLSSTILASSSQPHTLLAKL